MGAEETENRGVTAYRQAYEHVTTGFRTERGRRKMALLYLLCTASPPLTPQEEAAARAEMKRMKAR